MVATAAMEQALYSRLANGNHIARDSKVGLWLVIRKEDLRRELVITLYIVTGVYVADCLFPYPSIPSWIGWRITETIYRSQL